MRTASCFAVGLVLCAALPAAAQVPSCFPGRRSFTVPLFFLFVYIEVALPRRFPRGKNSRTIAASFAEPRSPAPERVQDAALFEIIDGQYVELPPGCSTAVTVGLGQVARGPGSSTPGGKLGWEE